MCDEGEQATCRRTLRCSDEGGGCTQMQDQSVYHSVTAQLTIQPSSSAVPSSVLLLAQTSLLRTKVTVNQQTTLTNWTAGALDPLELHASHARGVRSTRLSCLDHLAFAQRAHLPSQHHPVSAFALRFWRVDAHRCGRGVVGTIQLHVALQQPSTRQSHARRRDGCEPYSPLLCTSS